MTARVSRVGDIKVLSILFSSFIHIGDAGAVTPRSLTFAVQRQIPEFQGNEAEDDYLRKYPVFREPFPRPIVDEKVQVAIRNEQPFIDVGAMEVLGISNASIVQVGSNRLIDATSRIKHIRQLVSAGAPTGGSR